jgi:hypothetical protein
MNLTTGIVNCNHDKKCELLDKNKNNSTTITNYLQDRNLTNNNIMIIDENDHVIRMYILLISTFSIRLTSTATVLIL